MWISFLEGVTRCRAARSTRRDRDRDPPRRWSASTADALTPALRAGGCARSPDGPSTTTRPRWTSSTHPPAGTSTIAASRSHPSHLAMPLPDGSFETARRLICGYEFADPSLVRAHYDPAVPLQGREMVLELRALNLIRVFVGVRVVARLRRAADGRRAAQSRVRLGLPDARRTRRAGADGLDGVEMARHRRGRVPRARRFAPGADRQPTDPTRVSALRRHERRVFLDSTDRRMRELTALAVRARRPSRPCATPASS